MSAKFRLDELRDLWKARNDAIRNIPATMPNGFNLYLPAVQGSMIETERKRLSAQNKARIASEREKIVSEAKDVSLSIARLKQPSLASKDIQERAIGEQQVSNALHFLSTSPLAERIVLEIQNALSLNRVDYATALMDNCLNDIRRDLTGKVIPTEAQKQLQAELVAIYETFPGRDKIEQGKSDLRLYEVAQTIASDFAAQEEQGKDYVLLPELFPYLYEDQVNEAMQHVQGRSLVETVTTRRRISEAMTRAAG